MQISETKMDIFGLLPGNILLLRRISAVIDIDFDLQILICIYRENGSLLAEVNNNNNKNKNNNNNSR